MNKFFTKIAALSVGLAMAVGVGMVVASKREAAKIEAAAGDTLTFTITTSSTGYPSSYGTNELTLTAAEDNTKSMKVELKDHMKNNGNMQAKASSAYFRNKDVPDGYAVKSIAIANASGTTARTWAYRGGTSAITSSSGGSTVGSSSTTGATYGSGTTYSSTNYPYTYFFVYRNSSNANYASSYTITLVELATKTMSGITLGGSYQTVFTKGDTFNHDGMTVTANYSDGNIDVTNDATWSSPDMSTAGNKTVTVSYTDATFGLKTQTYSITVNEPKTVSNFELLGGISSGDTIKVTAEEEASSVTPDEIYYLLKFSDNSYGTPSLSWSNTDGLSNVEHYTNTDAGDDNGGYIEPTFTKNGEYTLTLSYSEETPLTITWKVKGFPNIEYVNDTLTPTNISNPSSYSDWSGKTKTISGINSEASYTGYSTGGTSKIQMRESDSGIYSAVSGGKISKVTIAWNASTTSDRDVVIYASNSAFSSVADILNGTEIASLNSLVPDTEYTFTSDYAYVGVRASGGALYLDSITFTWGVAGASTDTLKSIEITGNLTKTTYYAEQTVNTNGLTVTATFEDDEEQTYTSDVSADAIWTISYPTALAEDEGTTKLVTFEASYTFGSTTKTDSVEKTLTISADSVTGLGWGNRGTVDVFAGTTLGDAVDTTKWTFTPTWASGKSDTPSWGTGDNDVHVALYDTAAPTAESVTKLTSSYEFQASDNGKYLVAYYHGYRTGSNNAVAVTKWRSVTEFTTGHGTYNFSSVSGSSGITNTSTFNGYFSSNDGLTTPTITLTKVYQATSAVRLATGSATGSIVFNFGSMSVSSITIVAHGWSDSESACTMSITNGGTVTTTSDTASDTFNVNLSSAVSSVTFSAAKNNRICIESISFTASGSQEIGKTDDCLALETYIDTYLHWSDYHNDHVDGDDTGDGSCTGYYYGDNNNGAKAGFNALSLRQRQIFSGNSAYAAEWERLSDWAAANGETLNASSQLAQASNVRPSFLSESSNNATIIIVVISLVSLTAVGGYFLLKKKKER